MTTKDYMIKWAVYALALLPLCVADQLILGRLSPFGVAPLLFPLAAVAVGMMEGGFAGSIYGLATGVVWWLGGAGAPAILLLTLAGLLAGAIAQNGLSVNLISNLLVSALLLLVGDGLRVLLYLAQGIAPLPALLQVAVPEIVCSLVFAIPVYLLYRTVWRRVGGTRLA